MADMNPENNRDTFQGRGHRIKKLEEENEEHRKVFAEIFLALGTDETDRTKWAGIIREMKQLLKTIYESDALRSEDEELHDMVGKFVKESK